MMRPTTLRAAYIVGGMWGFMLGFQAALLAVSIWPLR